MIKVVVSYGAETLEKDLNRIEDEGGSILQVIVHCDYYPQTYTTIYREARKYDERKERTG